MVRLLVAEGVDLSLHKLPDELQTALTQQMSQMRYIDQDTLNSVVEEFVSELDSIGLSFPEGMEGALRVLEKSLSPSTASRLRKEVGVKVQGDPWEKIAGLGEDVLLSVLEEESAEIGAVMLSKLDVSVAAKLLGRLPGERARRITYAVSLTGQIEPDTVEKIGYSLAEQLDAQPTLAFADGPVERVGAILNFSPAATRDDVLEGLDEEDAHFAEQVRKAIFTFANIPQRIDARDIPKVIKGIDQAVLVKALAFAKGDLEPAANYILENMSKRMAEQLREEMGEAGKIKAAEGEEAMTEIVTMIRQLEASGEILLVAEDEDDEDA